MTSNDTPFIFIAASWKARSRVRALVGKLRGLGFAVYDFTDPACRRSPEIPPERYPVQYDSVKEPSYWDYLNRHTEWRSAIEENRYMLDRCTAVVLLLPCGMDATADWAYGVGRDKKSYVVGYPRENERSPVHLWADCWFATDDEFCAFLAATRTEV